MKTYKDTLRYKHMVARLEGLSPEKQETHLLQEIAKGRVWRQQAVLEAISKREGGWARINKLEVLETCARFGRLSTLMTICDTLKIAPKRANERTSDAWMNHVFDKAVIHDHYRVAEFALSRGASAEHVLSDQREPRAYITAILDGDLKKVDYLHSKLASTDYYFATAILSKNLDVVRHMVEKLGVSLNAETGRGYKVPLHYAVRFSTPEITDYLLEKGAKAGPNAGEIFHDLIGRGDAVRFKELMDMGVKPGQDELDRAVSGGKMDIARLIVDAGIKPNADTLLCAIVPKQDAQAFAFCIENGADARAALQSIQVNPHKLQYSGRERVIEYLETYLTGGTPAPKITPPRP